VKGSIHHAGGKSEWQRITGKAKVLDAHTLVFEDGTPIPLLLVAPDLDQMGQVKGSLYPCGKEVAEFLHKLIEDRVVTCFLVEAQGHRIRTGRPFVAPRARTGCKGSVSQTTMTCFGSLAPRTMPERLFGYADGQLRSR
jgi:hypothetical protein